MTVEVCIPPNSSNCMLVTPKTWHNHIRKAKSTMFPRSMLWRIEENLLLKLAVRKLQEEESEAQSRITSTEYTTTTSSLTLDESSSTNDWETTLFSPLGQEHSFFQGDGQHHHSHHQHHHSHPNITVSFAPEHRRIHTHPGFSSSKNIKSMGDLTVATEAESHLNSTTDAGSTHMHAACSDFEEDFHPVEVEWEDPKELLCCPRILTQSMMQYLHDHGIPEILQDNRWERCFAIGRDGDSFCSFVDRCAAYRHTLVVIQTTEGHVLGGFAAQAWRGQEGFGKRNCYYGTGQSFLFCSHPEEDDTSSESDVSPKNPRSEPELHIYKWTGMNDYCQICDVEESKIAMGGGGNFGLILEDGFWRGQTGRCGTYANPSMVPGGFFEVAAFEVYGVIPLCQSFHSSNSTRSGWNVEA